jgi:hypothetical protein
MRRRLGPILGAPLILILAACGGTSATNTPPPPATTAASSAATTAATATRTAGTAATPASPTASPASPTRAASTPGTPGTPRPAGTPATPGRATPGTPGTPGTPRTTGGTTTGTDETNTCQVGVPATFTAVDGQPGVWTDGTAVLAVTVVPMAGMDFATFIQALPALIAATPGTTIGATQQGPDRYRADFTAEADPTNLLVPYASAGTFVAVPASGGDACAAQLIFPQGQEQTYAPLVEPFVASVRSRQP